MSTDRDPATHWLGRLRRAAVHAPLWAVLVVCALILGARRPDMVVNPQFWAEDGSFYLWAHLEGASSLIHPYAGYLHTLPRLAGLLAAACDPLWAPALFVGLAAALTLYVAARTQSTRSPLAFSSATALAVVLVPDAFEVLLTITNLQWVTAGGLLLLLISADATQPRQHVHDGIAMLVLGLTGPFCIVLGPLFLARAWLRRSGASGVLAALACLCAAIQAWMIWKHPFPMPGDTVAHDRWLAVPGMRIGASLLVGHWVPEDFPRWIETTAGIGSIALAIALAVRRGDSRWERRWLGAAFLGLLASGLYRCKLVLPDLCHAGYGSRYFFPVQLALLWLLLLAVRDPRRWVARLSTVALAWMLAVNVPRLREAPLRDEHWPVYAAKLRAGEAVEIPINPEGWTVRFPSREALRRP